MSRPTEGREIIGKIVHRQMLVPTADNMGGQQLAADVIDEALAAKDAELTELREFRKAILRLIPMDYLQQHSPRGATGPTAETNVVAAMRDYSEARWKLIERVTELRTVNAELAGLLADAVEDETEFETEWNKAARTALKRHRGEKEDG